MKRIIISRTDSIGDVLLTLPFITWLRQKFPDAYLVYLGREYTEPIIACFPIDEFLSWNSLEAMPSAERVQTIAKFNADTIIHVFPNKEIAALAKKAKIPNRIGTSHRSFHLLTCNQRVNFTRKNSDFHEAQLNFHLLKPLGCDTIPSIDEVKGMLSAFEANNQALPEAISAILSDKGVVLHPKSQGSALEWPIEKYNRLALALVQRGYSVYFTGTAKEGDLFRSEIPVHPMIFDTTGKMNLTELITFIGKNKALVACSTGPLHIAGFLGLRTIGLFSPRKPIHPGRWAALGTNTEMLVFDQNCPKCKEKKACNCIENISVETVLSKLNLV
ncbi:MAG: glycosyltransferase family 9 protein [Bacteroidota bacterium]